MQNSPKHMLTNWKDGMKISKSHFEQSETALLSAFHQGLATTIKSYNYGLLPNGDGMPASLEVNVVKTLAESIMIKVSSCRAVTAGGIMVNLVPEICSEIQFNDSIQVPAVKNATSIAYYLVITADHAARVAAGNPNPEEEPLRLPYVHPEYRLDIVEKSELGALTSKAAYVVIGKLNSKGNDLLWDNNYIPPCTTVLGHKNLKNHYNNAATQFSTIQDCASSIINKVINKNQNSPLAFNIKYLCEKILTYVSSQFFPYRFILHQEAPIHFAFSIVQLANHIKLALELLPEKEKEDLLLYFKEWNDISPSQFDELLREAMEIDYDHHEIADSIEKLVEFTEVIGALLDKLNSLDLIGKRKGDKNMVVREISSGQKKKFKMID